MGVQSLIFLGFPESVPVSYVSAHQAVAEISTNHMDKSHQSWSGLKLSPVTYKGKTVIGIHLNMMHQFKSEFFCQFRNRGLALIKESPTVQAKG